MNHSFRTAHGKREVKNFNMKTLLLSFQKTFNRQQKILKFEISPETFFIFRRR